MQVFRLHIRPKGGLADHLFSFDYCRENGVLGLGWPLETPPKSNLTWEQYENLATKKYSKKDLSRVRNLRENVKPSDLIWTRDKGGKYYLAQVQSAWEYLDNDNGRKADITNVVRCEIKPVPHADDVPGKIVAHFRAPMSIQRVTESTTTSYTRWLWNQLTNSEEYLVEPENSDNLFALLGSETTEDVIFIYLQMNGWLILPNSRKADTMSYEFIAIKRDNLDNYDRAVVQVKTGNTPLNSEDYVNVDEYVFLFQANGNYKGETSAKVECLQPSNIEKFIRENIQVMPGVVQKWIKYMDLRRMV
jgi:hypothetical protein